MHRGTDSFRGEAPRVTPRALPDNAAQEAINARLLTGDLTAWKQFATTHELANSGSGPVRTIYLLDDAWLSWEAEVDAARGIIPGDTTFRTYLTAPDLYEQPRFTNYALATTGAEPYPVTTRPLGVPGPESAPTLNVGVDTSATTFSINITDDNASLATDWTTNPPLNSSGRVALVNQGSGYYETIFDENRDPGQDAYAYRNFGVAGVNVMEASCDVVFTIDGSTAQAMLVLAATSTGNGIGILYYNGFLQIRKVVNWAPNFGAAVVASVAVAGVVFDVTHTLRATVQVKEDGTKTITASIFQGSGELATVTGTNNFDDGDYCGFANGVIADVGPAHTYYSNYTVQASGSTGYVPENLATNYVYTFVNDLGEESAPSPASITITRPDGVSVTVTSPTVIPSGVSSDYGISTKRIYRAASGNVGTAFLFVAEIDLAVDDYVDTLTDAQLGEALETELWDLPPDDLEGILALPNGVMVGFRRNQLCLSAQDRPHAWPVSYRLTTDTDIVGLGNVDTTVVIGTESFVYVASGSDPSAYSMNKFEVPYACSSKRSFAYLTGIGVAFAGPDGLMAVRGIGQVENLTDTVFTREQWQALDPTSIVGVSHNDIYFMFWDNGAEKGCYAIDMKKTGFGVIQMAFHSTASFVDPIEDKMYLVLDADDEPDDPSLPMPAAPPTYTNGKTIFEFEGDQDTKMNYRWKSKLWLLERPAWFTIAQVRAEDFDNLLLRVYGDGVQIDEIEIVDETEFTLVTTDEYRSFQIELLGTSTVRLFQAAEDVTELV